MDQPKDKLMTGIFAFVGAVIGTILGLIAYVNE